MLGVNLGRESFWVGLISLKNKAEKFAEEKLPSHSLRNSPAIFLKFAGTK